MKLLKKFLMPALMVGSVFSTAAAAEENTVLPDAPSATASFKLKPLQPQFNYAAAQRQAFEYKIPPPPSGSSPFEESFIGKIAGYVDRHSSDSQAPFDFAMGYKIKDRFTIMAGTLSDLRKHSGKYEADRIAMRTMTGMPDWQTRSIRDTMSGGIPNRHHGSDGFAVGVKIQLGPK
ncbi:MAG: hypothetical protein EPN97_08945 [Alphaproteobacteria bacterium]|nr:MAG: hypothetical protein EPN97_08945 [Alphaproteobacteria bacterium]